MRVVFLIMLYCIVFISGCKTFEPEPQIVIPLAVPEQFSMNVNYNNKIKEQQLFFDSQELDLLLRQSLENNFDIKILKSKIVQAKARVAKEEASFLPDLGFSFGGDKNKVQAKSSSSSHSWNAGLQASYTADVWGEAAAGTKSQQFNLKAAQQDLDASELELTSQVAQTWINILAARNKKSILDNQIKTNTTLLKLQTLRFVNGKANALDVSQQREVLAGATSQVPLIEKQERILLNSLVFLSGKASRNDIQVDATVLPEPLPLPETGIPLDLLSDRPDIKAARMRLSSALWEITASKVDLLPSFKLTAQALFSSGTLDLLFQNWVASLAGSIAGPIFDGGFRRAEVRRVEAFAHEQLTRYARTIANAIREVEDRLVSIEKQDVFIKLLEEELEVGKLTLKDAGIQYQNGQSSYLSYLIALVSIQGLERQILGERATYITQRIQLYKDLGRKLIQ